MPIDFTVAAEFQKKAADSGDADGANGFGGCQELGQGVDVNIYSAMSYYERAASLHFSHPDGMYNLGRCLEYGIGTERGKPCLRNPHLHRLPVVAIATAVVVEEKRFRLEIAGN
jgi:hypothetical protein